MRYMSSPVHRYRSLAALFVVGTALTGCGEDKEPEPKDPDATSIRMVGPDGETMSAQIVPTDNGMRMRVEGNGESSTIEMQFPESFKDPDAAMFPDGGPVRMPPREPRDPDAMARRLRQMEEDDRKFDEGRDAMLKRFRDESEEFQRSFKGDGRRFDELRKSFPRPSGSSADPVPPSNPAAPPATSKGREQ